MKKFILLSFVLLSLLQFNCSSDSDVQIVLTNPVDIERTDEFISISLDSLKQKHTDFNFKFFSLYVDDREVPYQVIDKNILSFVVDFAPSEKKILILKNEEGNKEYKSRVYAEVAMKVDYNFVDGKYSAGRFENYDSVRVPDGHTDHNALFKYEGPGWESDKVGYRYYIDWRNRIDIFGKKTNDLVLKDVGVNDREAKDDSYHQMQDWGMDIFKVGSTLGIGSYGMMIDDSVYVVSERDSVICMITENGPVKAEVTTNFYGWKVGENIYDLTSALSITAGSRLSKAELVINSNPQNLITGLAKDPKAEFYENRTSQTWSYIALYGNHSLADDNVGIALFYNNNELIELKEISDSYTVLLKPMNEKVIYYFCAAWEKEPDGLKNSEEFISYLNETLERLNNPVSVEY